MATDLLTTDSHTAAKSTVFRSSSSEDGVTEISNQAFVLSPTRQFSYEERTLSRHLSPRHVRVRVVATGLCGSDVSKSVQLRPRVVTNCVRYTIGNMDELADILLTLLLY